MKESLTEIVTFTKASQNTNATNTQQAICIYKKNIQMKPLFTNYVKMAFARPFLRENKGKHILKVEMCA